MLGASGEEGTTCLFDQLVVDGDISIGAIEGLLQEGEEDGYNDGGLQGLSKDDEEDGNGEYVDGHDLMRRRGRRRRRRRITIGLGEERGA